MGQQRYEFTGYFLAVIDEFLKKASPQTTQLPPLLINSLNVVENRDKGKEREYIPPPATSHPKGEEEEEEIYHPAP